MDVPGTSEACLKIMVIGCIFTHIPSESRIKEITRERYRPYENNPVW